MSRTACFLALFASSCAALPSPTEPDKTLNALTGNKAQIHPWGDHSHCASGLVDTTIYCAARGWGKKPTTAKLVTIPVCAGEAGGATEMGFERAGYGYDFWCQPEDHQPSNCEEGQIDTEVFCSSRNMTKSEFSLKNGEKIPVCAGWGGGFAEFGFPAGPFDFWCVHKHGGAKKK